MIAKKPFVGGNWKCNGTKSSLHDLIQILNDVALDRDVDVVVAPTSLHIPFVQAHLKNPLINIAAQNCVPKPGAFTGEVALPSLVDHGVGWVIIGHSERRQIFGETDVDVAEKVQAALALGVSVIACIGETLPEREEGDFMNNHLKPQLLVRRV
jgi:triosephosphate isomerase